MKMNEIKMMGSISLDYYPYLYFKFHLLFHLFAKILRLQINGLTHQLPD